MLKLKNLVKIEKTLAKTKKKENKSLQHVKKSFVFVLQQIGVILALRVHSKVYYNFLSFPFGEKYGMKSKKVSFENVQKLCYL